MTRATGLRWGMLAAVLAACHKSPPPEFRIASTSPALGEQAAPLLLNDSITVHFAAPIAGLSVTEESFAVLDRDGRRVPGTLRTGSHWVSFVPEPPLSPTLGDGSFAPGERYELRIAGMPRPDAVRAADGRRLAAAVSLPFRAAARDEVPPGLVAPLRPPVGDLPLLLHANEAPGAVPADNAVVYLRFSSPLLPASVRAEAFEVKSLNDLATLAPSRVRAVTLPGDALPGSSVEILLAPARGSGNPVLAPGDWLSVALVPGETALRDYRGERVLPAPPQFWSVLAGGAVELLAVPGERSELAAAEPLGLGFEVREGRVRPRVRAELGGGKLGVLQPTRDLTLRAGERFDRGDGVLVRPDGGRFEFAGITIPAGVTVTLDGGAGPVQLLVAGSVEVAGRLLLAGGVAAMDDRQLAPQPVTHWLELGSHVVAAAGEVALPGEVFAAAPVGEGATPLVLACCGQVKLGGALPFRTVLVVESSGLERDRAPVVGPRGQALLRSALFAYGPGPGGSGTVAGLTEWVAVPVGTTVGEVRLDGVEPGLEVAWQATPADPLRSERPDPARAGRFEPVRDGDRLALTPGTFVRLRLGAEVAAGRPVPSLRSARILLP